MWARLTLAPRVIPPAEAASGHALVLAAIRDGAGVSAAVEGTTVVGLAISRRAEDAPRAALLALGVAPAWRRNGLATHAARDAPCGARPGDVDHEALITVAERDPIEPLDVSVRTAVARRLLDVAGFDVASPGAALGSADPTALRATRSALCRAGQVVTSAGREGPVRR